MTARLVLTALLALATACRADPEVPRATPSPVPTASPAMEGAMHDHTPHHGGVVGMSGSRHVEAIADAADGSVRAWVTDFWRKAIPLDGASGTVTLELPGGKRAFPLSVEQGTFVAVGLPIAGDGVDARFELTIAGEPVLIDFYLPIASGRRGAAGVPAEGCQPVAPRGDARLPRCALPFHRDIGTIAATPAGDRLLVSALDAGVSEWAMPDAELLLGFAPPPAIAVPSAEAARPHPEVSSAIAVRPDGRETVVALESRLLRYATADGALARELAPAKGVVRDVAWSPDAATLLVASFYDPAAHLVAAEDGAERRALAVEREASAVAFSRDGAVAAVASEAGGVTLFATATGGRLRVLDTGPHPAQAVAFLRTARGEAVVAGGRDGIVRLWDAATGAPAATSPPGRSIVRIAVAHGAAPDAPDRAIAVSGIDGDLRLLRPDASVAAALRWHGGTVTGLAWAGDTLVSGDDGGRVGLWDLGDLLRSAR